MGSKLHKFQLQLSTIVAKTLIIKSFVLVSLNMLKIWTMNRITLQFQYIKGVKMQLISISKVVQLYLQSLVPCSDINALIKGFEYFVLLLAKQKDPTYLTLHIIQDISLLPGFSHIHILQTGLENQKKGHIHKFKILHLAIRWILWKKLRCGFMFHDDYYHFIPR